MVSLTIHLDEDVAESLRQMARDDNRSESDVVREAITCYARNRPTVLPKGMGQYHSGRSDVSGNAREILRRAVEDQRWP